LNAIEWNPSPVLTIIGGSATISANHRGEDLAVTQHGLFDEMRRCFVGTGPADDDRDRLGAGGGRTTSCISRAISSGRGQGIAAAECRRY